MMDNERGGESIPMYVVNNLNAGSEKSVESPAGAVTGRKVLL